jgi:PAS domain S-box-containing protein
VSSQIGNSALWHRGNAIVAEHTLALYRAPDVSTVAEAVADHLRTLLRTKLVSVFVSDGANAELHAVAAESPSLAALARARYGRNGLQFAADLARRAIVAGETISITIDPATQGLDDVVPAGVLLAAPFRTSRTSGAILVYPRSAGPFSAEERSLLGAVCGFGAVAMANAEICATGQSEARGIEEQLQKSEEARRRAESLMGITSELNRHLQLREFGRNFVRHAAEITGADDVTLALKRGANLETVAAYGTRAEQEFSSPAIAQAISELLTRRPEPIVSCDASELGSVEPGWCSLVRLQGGEGQLAGVLCLSWKKSSNRADEPLLQAISAPGSIALENARMFTRMDRANHHWIELFDAITDFIVAHDRSDNVLRVNRSLADFIGLQPREMIGLRMSALFARGTEVPEHACPFCRTMANEQPEEHIISFLDRAYLISTSRVHEPGSEDWQTVHVLKDITDRQEAERRYRELFDNIQEGVFFATPDGYFVEVNDALVRMLGYRSREDLLQADIRGQVSSSVERYDEFARLMMEHGAVRNHEQTLRRADGSFVQVVVNAFAVRDARQNIVQYRGAIQDISGLRSSQSELQRERDFSAKILDNTQSLILVADTSGHVRYANRRWHQMAYEQYELLGRRLEELIAAPRRPALLEAFAATLDGQQIDNLELQVARGEGGAGHFAVNLSPMRDEHGNITSVAVVMSDITDAATLQSKLVHAEKLAAVGQLVSGVAHEVNNPLTAILGFADLLMENPEIPDSARKDLRVILQEAQRTKQIVQNLLSFARQMPPQRKPVQLNAILRRTVQLRAYDLHSRGVEVVEQLEKDLRQVIGDSHQLQQVFLNILNNAYDAVRDTGRPARIEIITANHDDAVEVRFRDNGKGIEFPQRIFDPFFTTKEVGKGTGLGLSICYGIVREHGGEIVCHNNAEGEGATFIVRLPAAADSLSIAIAAGVTPS